eukprot:Ihof_evm2s652 gene=Ihof_evmTU2s652
MWKIFVIATACKLLLLPTYHSTDFEVHRNWLAITHSLPVSKWYYEDTSIWTLDYPPFFAWFEYGLSHGATRFDPNMLNVTNLDYASNKTVLFQRLSVMATDSVLLYATNEASQIFPRANFPLRRLGRFVEGGIVFAILMNFKHLFLAVAPAYFVYLLAAYCFEAKTRTFYPSRFLLLGGSVLSIFCLSLGPFIWNGQLLQVVHRLFPFKRGLVHAYWAPNFWALYSATDKVLALALGVGQGQSVMTGGIVGEATHLVLPKITPLTTMIVTLLSMLPLMIVLWKRGENGKTFSWAVVQCGFCMYMFGWHVHEKAIITVLLPLCLLAVEDAAYAHLFTALSLPAHYSLFPLLYESKETPIKVGILVIYTIFTSYALPAVSGHEPQTAIIAFFEKFYILGFVVLQ